jgi:hypothetical protein
MTTAIAPVTHPLWCGGRLCDDQSPERRCLICVGRHTMRHGASVETALDAVAPVLRLHTYQDGPIKDSVCWDGDCEHDDGSCPVLALAYCRYCAARASDGDTMGCLCADDDDCDFCSSGGTDDDLWQPVHKLAYWPCPPLQQIEAIFGLRIERIIARLERTVAA